MSTPLLATKLFIPPPRSEMVSRPHLLGALNEGLSCKLTLVAAPAGYGKTTLLSEWVRQIDAPVAWLSLDESDNDLTRFLAYFFAALQHALPDLDLGGMPLRPSPQLPPIEVILLPLLNDLAALDSAVVVVLDDLHLIEVDPIHQVLTFLLEHIPPQVHLVIATRADPRLPLARLRAKRELVELREAALRFTPGEASALLNDKMGLSLAEDQIHKLTSRTEGWISGLLLAAISMQGKQDLAAFIEAFTGSHEYIVDYLTDEVLIGLPEDLQTFLLETSLLDRLSGPLCEAITGQEAGQATLEHLRVANLFLLPMDDQRIWYRYHGLFADHLRKRLRHSQPDRVGALHRRASEWYEQNDLMPEAIDHALSARDFDRAADLIEQMAEGTMMRSEFGLFLRWAGALPGTVLNHHPMVGVAQAMSLLMTGKPVEEVEKVLQGLNYQNDAHRGGRSVVQATLAVVLGQLTEAHERAQQALGLLSAEANKSLREIAHWIIGYTSALESKPSEGLRILENVVQESRASGNVMLQVAASFEKAKLYTYQGRLQTARKSLEEGLDLARDRRGNLLPIAGEGLIALGELSREANQLEDAEQTLLKGIELSKWGRTATSYRGYISLAKVRLAQGDEMGAYDYFQTAKEQAAFEFDQLYVGVAEAKARLSQGDLAAADRWLEARGWTAEPGLLRESESAIEKHIHKYEHLLQARVLLAKNQLDQAHTSLQLLLRQMEQQERLDVMIEVQILRALAYQSQGHSTEALDALQEALSLAGPGGYVRIFVEEGEPMRRLLLEASARGMDSDYCGRLLAAYPAQRPGEGPSSSRLQYDLIEPLSGRELQVLRLLASPLTSPEIADELYISVNTARFHIKNIYAKLDVHRRAEAVDRARALGLI